MKTFSSVSLVCFCLRHRSRYRPPGEQEQEFYSDRTEATPQQMAVWYCEAVKTEAERVSVLICVPAILVADRSSARFGRDDRQ